MITQNENSLFKKYLQEMPNYRSTDIFDLIVLCCYEELIRQQIIKKPINLPFLRGYLSQKDFGNNIARIRDDLKDLSYGEIVYIIQDAITVLRDLPEFNRLANDGGEIIGEIIYRLLEFKDGDTFVDYGSGYGLIMIDQYHRIERDRIKLREYAGIEQDPVQANICQALIGILDLYIPQNIHIGNMFTEKMGSYSKGYIYPALGRIDLETSKQIESIESYDGVNVQKFNQWSYVNQLLSSITFENGGRAIAILHPKSLMETKNNKSLQDLLHSGKIEAVVKLPKILSSTYVNPFLVVFSNCNEKVKIMDASGDAFFPSCIRKNVFRYSNRFDFDRFMQIYKQNDNEYLKELSCNVLSNYNNWDPSIIFALLKSNKDGYVPLVDFLDDMFIGLQVHVANFKQEEGGDYKAISVGDINGNYGEIDFDNLKKFDEGDFGKFVKRRYKLKKGDVLITTKSSVNKITVIEEDPPEPVVPIGGIIVLRPDLNRLNPTYLKMYLESEEGQKMLKDSSVSSGAVFIISLRNFRENMYIRPIPIEGQNEKVEKYNNLIKQLRQKRQEVEALDASLKEIFKE